MREKVESKKVERGVPSHKRARVHNNFKSEDLILKRKVQRLQLAFVTVLIAPIRFSWFATLNVMYLHRSVRDLLESKFYSKLAVNEYYFPCFLE